MIQNSNFSDCKRLQDRKVFSSFARPEALGSESNVEQVESIIQNNEMKKLEPYKEDPDGSKPNVKLKSKPQSRSALEPYFRWAEDISNLLGDPEGIELYKSYLEQESLKHLFNFWFACEGLKKQVDDKTILKYVKVINRNFISCSGASLHLKSHIKSVITEKIANKNVDKNIFDEAQACVREFMVQTTYPNFLKSDVYLHYIQKHENGSETDSHSSTNSSSNNVCPVDTQSDGVSENQLSNEEQISKSFKSENESSFHLLSLSRSALPTLHENTELKFPEQDISKSMPLTHEALISSNKQFMYESLNACSSSFPYHAYGSTYNPVSRQDSEIQSQSSGAHGGDTTDDNFSSFTESSSIITAERLNKRNKNRLKLEKKRIHDNIKRNKDDLHTIPRPNRVGQVPPKTMTTEEFANILTKRLQAHIDSQKSEKKSFEMLTKKLNIIESNHRVPVTQEQESDQSILDEHVSRIWQDKTPVYAQSPGEPCSTSKTLLSKQMKHNSSGCKTLPSHKSNSMNSSQYYHGPISLNPYCQDSYSLKKKDVSCYSDSAWRQNCHENLDLNYINQSHNLSNSSRLSDQNRVQKWIQNVNFGNPNQYEDIKSDGKVSKEYTFPKFKSSSSSSNWKNPSTHQQLKEVNRRLLNHNPSTTSATTVMYTFSNEPNGMPYRVKIQAFEITLKVIKDNLPKNGQYRYYFKTKVDGEPCFEEERDNHAIVPLWDELKVVVQCRDDLV